VFDVWTSAAIGGVTITGGSAPGSFGGGIFSAPEESTLELFVDGVHFTGNQADNGGAILNDLGSNLTITNSSLSGNTAAVAGGALNNRNDVAMLTSTISGNDAGSGDGIASDFAATLDTSRWPGTASWAAT
jgi:hypothetical protein